jgi:hypothetical protein
MKPALRPFDQEQDLALVKDSWVRSSLEQNLSFKRNDIEMLIGQNQVTVCCEGTMPVLIYGWICHGTDAAGYMHLWYLYVKHLFRRNGIGSWIVRNVMEPSGIGHTWNAVIMTPALRKVIERVHRLESINGEPRPDNRGTTATEAPGPAEGLA